MIKIEGANGFGYDPIFLFSAMSDDFGNDVNGGKNKYSHRAKALKKLYTILKEIL